MRQSLVHMDFYGPCLTKRKNKVGVTLHFYGKDGTKHTVVFEGTTKVLWFEAGVVNIDDREYFCDKWLVRHFEFLLREDPFLLEL